MPYHKESKKIFNVLWRKTKDLDLSINCILVYNNIRPSYLFQHEGYPEYDGSLNKVKIIISDLGFKLIEIDQGILVVNKGTNLTFDKDNYTNRELGLFLGYACAGDIDDNRNYGFNITAEYDNYWSGIYAMVCGSIKEDIYYLFDNIKGIVFKINEHIKITYSVEKIYDYTIDDQIRAIQKSYHNKINIKKSMKKEILQTLWNYGYGLTIILHDEKIIDIFCNTYYFYILTLLLVISADEYYNVLENIPDEQIFRNVCKIQSKQAALFQKNYLENVFNIPIKEYYDIEISKIDEEYH